MALKVFLTALAIADDIGAIMVIAFFYTSDIRWAWLAFALVALVGLVALNRLGVDGPWWYFALGVVLWFGMLQSGVHATLAGVIAAFTIPATARLTPPAFSTFARQQLDLIDASHDPDAHVLESDVEQECAFAVREAARRTAAPLQRLEFALTPVATFVVLPLFALANAGVDLSGVPAALADPAAVAVAGGIALGLALGKPLGIALFAWLAVRIGVADLPAGTRWPQVVGAGVLGGIGFTVSLFVATLAFDQPVLLGSAKVAILVTSVAIGAAGYVVLRMTSPADGGRASS